MSTTYRDGRNRARRPPVPDNRLLISKKLLKKERIVVVRRDYRQDSDMDGSLESGTLQE
jgi:hypothetical protein